jgi:peptide/nickel transport system permease protein
MTDTSPLPASIPPSLPEMRPERSRGYHAEVWRQFRRRRLSFAALLFVVALTLIAILSPAIAGTKPIACRYKGKIYFPALGYFYSEWENPIFNKDKFRRIYPKNLEKKDPESWAIWPLLYQDPYRRLRDGEWKDRPGNPIHDQGGPSLQNLFGTTDEGVDVFASMVHGTRVALLVGVFSTGISALIGIAIGALSGYFRGWVDVLLSRFTEVVMCVPAIVLILAMISIFEETSIWHVMAVLGATGWPGIARLTRGEFLRLREMEFVTGARAMGAGWIRIIFAHILPNALAPVLVPISFGIASAILVESALSFLGFGSPPPNPSWGTLLNSGRANLQMWWLTVFPGAAIFLTVLAYNLIGEGLQEATDPRLRNNEK